MCHYNAIMEYVHKALCQLGDRPIVPFLAEQVSLPLDVCTCQDEHHYKRTDEVRWVLDPMVQFLESIASDYLIEAAEGVSYDERALEGAHKGYRCYYLK
jgi:hypothetical protein